MKHAMMVGVLSLGILAVPVTAQIPLAEKDSVAVYVAILRELPTLYPDRKALVDPRILTLSLRDAAAMDVWEHRLTDAIASPVVQRLHRNVDGLSYCTEVPSRANCLKSTQYVHVMFGPPVVEGSTVNVEVTFAARTFDDRDAFGIQSFRYSFRLGEQDASITDRVLLAAGHGRISKH